MSSMHSKLMSMASGSKPVITISLNDPRTVYTTLDKISGKVSITVSQATKFEHVSISLTGASKTYIERMSAHSGMSPASMALQNFLKLTQPMPESVYPQPKILQPGRTYEFSFLFVVPQRLLPKSCRHATNHDSVRDLHLQLPPSLGSAKGGNEARIKHGEDIAPLMANVSYHIVAVVQDKGKHTLATESKWIRILPKFAEQPPVDIDGPRSDYYLRREKTIKKGLLKGRLGSLVVEADQPRSFRLPSGYPELQAGVSTAAKIKLRFDPTDASVPPPRLSRLSSRIKASTWFADTARSNIPDKSCIPSDIHQGLYAETISLNTRPMEMVEWTFQKEDQRPSLVRKDSGLSGCSTKEDKVPSPSEQYKGNGFFTAEIFVPITLPEDIYFVPTFHSCLISRTYTLYLDLRVQGGTVTAPAVQLKIPVQITAGVEGDSGSEYSSSSAEELDETQFAEEFFAPRTISPMDERLVGNSRLSGMVSEVPSEVPPEYETFRNGNIRART